MPRPSQTVFAGQRPTSSVLVRGSHMSTILIMLLSPGQKCLKEGAGRDGHGGGSSGRGAPPAPLAPHPGGLRTQCTQRQNNPGQWRFPWGRGACLGLGIPRHVLLLSQWSTGWWLVMGSEQRQAEWVSHGPAVLNATLGRDARPGKEAAEQAMGLAVEPVRDGAGAQICQCRTQVLDVV